jgi:hypothetical protein
MSVISTLITRASTVHTSDSLVTKLLPDGRYEPGVWQETKIVPVRAWRGALSYWGLSLRDGQWSTLQWLRDQSRRAGASKSPQAFAEAMVAELNSSLGKMALKRPEEAGIGIHFSAYERVDLRWIPELFLVTNYADPTYRTLRPMGVSRETHHILFGQEPSSQDGEAPSRLEVANALENGRWLIYNNGDPWLYNIAANSILQMACKLQARGILRGPDDIEVLRALARRPVEVVSTIQHDFCVPDKRVVGGRIHDLAITPSGDYSSTSGDAGEANQPRS